MSSPFCACACIPFCGPTKRNVNLIIYLHACVLGQKMTKTSIRSEHNMEGKVQPVLVAKARQILLNSKIFFQMRTMKRFLPWFVLKNKNRFQYIAVDSYTPMTSRGMLNGNTALSFYMNRHFSFFAKTHTTRRTQSYCVQVSDLGNFFNLHSLRMTASPISKLLSMFSAEKDQPGRDITDECN